MQHWIKAIAFLCLAAASVRAQSSEGITFYPQTGQAASPPPVNVPPEQRCVLAGRVTNAITGEPVRKATLRLTTRGGMGSAGVIGPVGNVRPFVGPGQGYSASTEADGSFRIEGINPGPYSLSVNRTGFLNTNYGAKRPNQSGSVITLAPSQQITDLNVPMTPQAVITGKVIDTDGDPVSGGMVQVLMPMWMRGKLRYTPRGGNQINDLGEYRIPNLAPGKYYVFAKKQGGYIMPSGEPIGTGKPDVRPVRTYYPSSTTFTGAAPVEIKAGQDLSGIDIRMQSAPTYHIRGHVSGAPAANGARERTMLSLAPREDDLMGFNGGGTTLRPDGTFDMAGVAPGAYYLTLMSMDGQVRSFARQAVDVGGGDVDGLALTVTPPGSMRGVARIEGTPPANGPQISASSLHLSLQPAEMIGMMGPPPSAKFAEDGTFTLNNVTPGKFYVQVNSPPGTYLKSVRFGSSEILGKELDLSGGVGGELDLTFRYGPGEIDGQIDTGQNSAANSSPTQCVLVPEVLNADGSGLRFGALNSKGAFVMGGLAPGRYRLYAVEDLNFSDFQNPDLLKQMEGKSPLIEVKEGEKKQVQIVPISHDEFEQISARLGLQLQ